jgi:hypothetical protein
VRRSSRAIRPAKSGERNLIQKDLLLIRCKWLTPHLDARPNQNEREGPVEPLLFEGGRSAGCTLAQQDSAERTYNKLARTFASQVEALKRYRSAGEQTVRVEHVTVNEGGQAIVGNVAQGAGLE